ncbi:unnamed protein product [Gongylonema pulchrum]|uniref:Anaphase-promoting complex subunit 1 n=1 Tax=Gongylonema pulchrum TaxID=637853 RepID=A0A183ETD3_9BILA|nr:unnamed protein product [Gongylonema pulchrum]
MVCPILSSSILHESYASFLSIYEKNRQIYDVAAGDDHPKSMECCFFQKHLYAMCSLRHHSQPLTEPPNNKSGSEEDRTSLRGIINFPDINVTFFQCGLIEKTIQSASLEDSVSHLARSSVILFHFEKSDLLFSRQAVTKNKNLPDMEFTLQGHAQFLQLVESWKLDFAYNKSFCPNYTTNWNELNLSDRLTGYDLRVVAGLLLKLLDSSDDGIACFGITDGHDPTIGKLFSTAIYARSIFYPCIFCVLFISYNGHDVAASNTALVLKIMGKSTLFRRQNFFR